ncbi:phage tail protein I [Guyparkeria sp. GHLCS8-2]|uniref:phage tail protein I n=1 Tax=Guyparkeria halopsychrophila TaxID=3139421 RepID=UPI0037C6A644
MSNRASLLPPSATQAERAIEQATGRLEDVPTPQRTLWDPDTCPADLLPWLAWALSLDAWQPYWPESVKRERIRKAIEIQRKKGTARSVRDTVASFGGALSIKEWWQNDPPTEPHTFDLLLTVGGDVPATTEYQNDIIDEVSRVKPVRSHFTLTAGVNADGAIAIAGAARLAQYQRLSLTEA